MGPLLLKFFHNAFFSLEDDRNRLVFDPWVTQGILDSGWYTSRIVADDYFEDGKNLFIFCSHPHPDHFDLDFLLLQQAPIFVPVFNLPACQSLKKAGKEIVPMIPFEWKNIGKFRICCTPGLNGMDFDSSFLIEYDSHTFYFGSDNSPKNKEVLAECVNILGRVDIAAINYSRADDHPAMFSNLTVEEKHDQRTKGLHAAFEVFVEAVQILQPKVVIPCAGDYLVRRDAQKYTSVLKLCLPDEIIAYAQPKLDQVEIINTKNYSSWLVNNQGMLESLQDFSASLPINEDIPLSPWYENAACLPRPVARSFMGLLKKASIGFFRAVAGSKYDFFYIKPNGVGIMYELNLRNHEIREVPRDHVCQGEAFILGTLNFNYLVFLLNGFTDWNAAQSGLHITWYRKEDIYCPLFYFAVFQLRTKVIPLA